MVSVLHINTAKSWRGGEQQVFYLAEELQKRGVPQVVVCPPHSELFERCERAGIPVRAVVMRGEWDLFGVRKIVKIARELGVTLIHAHTARAHTIGMGVKRSLPRLKLVVSRRVDFPLRPNYFSKRKYFSPLVDRYIAISRNVERILLQDGIAPERIGIAYSGIDLTRFASLSDPTPLREEFGLGSDEVIFGNVAALTPHKDQKTLLRAFARLVRELNPRGESPFVRLLIVGEGELREELTSLAGELGLEEEGRVIFTGFRREIPLFFSLFDVFVMSSSEEGLGTSVLDAMASGLPVCTTSGGGLPEMVDPEKGGYVTPVGDDQALSQSMLRMVLSPSLRQEFGSYNRERVRDFSREATCASTLKIYSEVLGSSNT